MYKKIMLLSTLFCVCVAVYAKFDTPREGDDCHKLAYRINEARFKDTSGKERSAIFLIEDPKKSKKGQKNFPKQCMWKGKNMDIIPAEGNLFVTDFPTAEHDLYTLVPSKN